MNKHLKEINPEWCEECLLEHGWTKSKPTPPQTDKTTWEKKLDELTLDACPHVDTDKIKKLFSEELKKAREEQFKIDQMATAGETVGLIDKVTAQALDVYRGKLIKKIEKLDRKFVAVTKDDNTKLLVEGENMGYEHAKREILTLIKEEKI
jgi:hypothetical protein